MFNDQFPIFNDQFPMFNDQCAMCNASKAAFHRRRALAYCSLFIF